MALNPLDEVAGPWARKNVPILELHEIIIRLAVRANWKDFFSVAKILVQSTENKHLRPGADGNLEIFKCFQPSICLAQVLRKFDQSRHCAVGRLDHLI